MELRLDGKTAVITGASRGIGQAMASSFAAAGASVMLSSRKADALAQAKAEIDEVSGERAGEVAWHVANAGDPEQAEACMAATMDRFGSVDILVNNAATNPYYGPIIEIDTARADKTVRVNQSGYLEWAQSAWRAGMSERGGVVLNLASIGGPLALFLTHTNFSVSSAVVAETKFWILLTRCCQIEARPVVSQKPCAISRSSLTSSVPS